MPCICPNMHAPVGPKARSDGETEQTSTAVQSATSCCTKSLKDLVQSIRQVQGKIGSAPASFMITIESTG